MQTLRVSRNQWQLLAHAQETRMDTTQGMSRGQTLLLGIVTGRPRRYPVCRTAWPVS